MHTLNQVNKNTYICNLFLKTSVASLKKYSLDSTPFLAQYHYSKAKNMILQLCLVLD